MQISYVNQKKIAKCIPGGRPLRAKTLTEGDCTRSASSLQEGAPADDATESKAKPLSVEGRGLGYQVDAMESKAKPLSL